MKLIILCCVAALGIVSCSSNTVKQAKTDTVIAGDTLAKAATTAQTNHTPTVSSLCFLRTEGKTNQDSTSIELVIKGDVVSGQMTWMPYQKDSRKGVLAGTIKGDTIQAKWSFMQEGMNDTLNLKFKLTKDQLAQKPLKLNVKTGRDQTDDDAGYKLLYKASTSVKK
ncbi:hypothetical protein [Mucilaginibacter polytrichastri]|uniref:Lipocalin-like domain-containing protein n=1 Tax=Mucilaginibacter polytrichastri TaxID=1302689 RepID=A0A1Q6A3A9_9SPHI|nr:hypothetical protein [Mucilaginibacter polytrichastri]OKS88481.1 hypothetical protein RG47T_3948 [Mucilaginibacter polytrichastri]SFT12183.1 hypothetical protein SAMN04487890_111143 [Mucilaginibacter polytrichastri]